MTEIKIVPFLCDIPSAAVELEINAKVYLDGEIQSYRAEVNMEEIRKGIVTGGNLAGTNATYFLKNEEKELSELDE